MGYGKITAKQQEILNYIKDEILKRGYPPAVREICEAVHLKSTSSVHSHLETLEKNGYIKRDPTKPRAIEICDDNFQMVRTEMVSIPVIGQVAAGQPILAEENIESYFPVPAEFVPSGESFALKVKGRFHDQCRYFQRRSDFCAMLPDGKQWRHSRRTDRRLCDGQDFLQRRWTHPSAAGE